MDVSLDQKNDVESGIGGSKSVAGHQAEQANSILSIEAMKCSANKTGEVSQQYEDYTEKLWDRDKCVAKHLNVIRR